MNKFVKAHWERTKDEKKIISEIAEMEKCSKSQAKKMLNQALSDDVYINDKYQVAVRKIPATDLCPEMIHLSIKTHDKTVEHDWREFQEIKNQLVGEENEAVELYPAESRKVDASNQYHLFCFSEKENRFPFGFTRRLISDKPLSNGRQRPL